MRALLITTWCSILITACADSRVAGGDAGIPPLDDGGSPGTDGGGGAMDAPMSPASPLVDPSCTDGRYAETLPTSNADIADLVAAYDPSMAEEFILALLQRRYGIGHHLVSGALSARDCITPFLNDISSAQAVIASMGTVVHECGHMFDNSRGSFSANTYVITPSLSFTCAQGDATDRGGLTFARSRIQNDEYAPLRPSCAGSFPPGCDLYSDIYLDGDPDDGTFQGGDQGFNLLFEEVVQYVNSLATALAFTGEIGSSSRRVSERDGILTFLWYLMRYLRMARLQFPSAYAHIVNGDGGCWRDAVLTVWGRAWLYLEATAGMVHLGIDDAALMNLVMDPDLLDEIQRLRDAAGC